MKRTKSSIAISMILCIALTFELVFSESVAIAFATGDISQSKSTEEIEVYEESDIVETGSDYTVFANDDGSETLVMYSSDVRTSEDGELVDVDNSLELTEDGYRNVNGFTDVSLPETVGADSQITVTNKDNRRSVSFVPVFSSSAAEAAALLNQNVENEVSTEDNGELEDKAPHEELRLDEVIEGEAENLLNEKSQKEIGVRYETPDPDVYMEYIPLDSGIKENIVLTDVPSSSVFSFVVNCENQIPELSHRGIEFKDKNTGEVLGAIQEPFMQDSSEGEDHGYSEELSYGIESLGHDSYRLDLTVSEEYLQDEARVYPVIIDPTYTASTSSTVKEAYVLSAHSSTNYFSNSVTQMCIGRGSTDGVARTYMQFPNLQSTISGKYINSATFKVTEKNNTNTKPTLGIYRLTASFTPGSVTWSNKPSNNSTLYASYKLTGSGAHTLNVTNLVQGWASSTYSNYGIVLKATSEAAGTTTFSSFYGSRYGTAGSRPTLTVTYTTPSPSKPAKPTVGVSKTAVKPGTQVTASWTGLTSNILDAVQIRIAAQSGTDKLAYTNTGTAAASGSYNINTSGYGDGQYTVYIRGTDKLGKTGDAGTKKFIVDNTAPGKVSGISLNSERMSDESSLAKVSVSFQGAEDVTNEGATPSGVREYRLQLYNQDNNSTIGDEVTVSNTEYTFEDIEPGTDVFVKIKAVDRAGNEGEYETSEVHRIDDLNLPEFNRRGSFEPEDLSDTIWISGDGTGLRVSWNAEYDSEIPKITAGIVTDGDTPTTVFEEKQILTDENSLLSYDGYRLERDFNLNTLPEGRYKAVFKFYGRDETGYTKKEVPFGIDNTAPVIHNGENGTSAIVPSDGSVLTNTTTIAYDCDDDGSGIAETRVTLISTFDSKRKVLTESEGVINLDTLDYDDGEYILKFEVTDRAGNKSEETIHITIMNPPPTPRISLESDVGAPGVPAVVNWNYVSGDNTVSRVSGLEYAVKADGEPADSDFTEIETDHPDENGSVTIPTDDISVEDECNKEIYIYLRAKNATGDKGTTRKLTYVIDNEPPEARIWYPYDDGYVFDTTEIYGYVSDYTTNVSCSFAMAPGETEDPSVFEEVVSDNDQPGNSLGVLDLSDSTKYEDGEKYTLRIHLLDEAGNTSDIYKTVTKHAGEKFPADFKVTDSSNGTIRISDERCRFDCVSADDDETEYELSNPIWYVNGNIEEPDQTGLLDFASFDDGLKPELKVVDRKPDGSLAFGSKSYFYPIVDISETESEQGNALRNASGGITIPNGETTCTYQNNGPFMMIDPVSIRLDIDDTVPEGCEIKYYVKTELQGDFHEIENHREYLLSDAPFNMEDPRGQCYIFKAELTGTSTTKPVINNWTMNARMVDRYSLDISIADSFDVSDVHAQPQINSKVLVT